jgi:hypothetical protein
MAKRQDTTTSAYSQKLRDPRWQKMRLQILEADKWTCRHCGDTESTLHVHHKYYERGAEPWDYPLTALITLCEHCHATETECLATEEKLIVSALRRCGWMASDFNYLRAAVECAEVAPEVISGVIWWVLGNDARREEIITSWRDFIESGDSEIRTFPEHVCHAEYRANRREVPE